MFFLFFFFFNDTATTEIYTLSLHDALPIYRADEARDDAGAAFRNHRRRLLAARTGTRSEEHTSELQSHSDLVCRLLLEKKKKNNMTIVIHMHDMQTVITKCSDECVQRVTKE